MREKKHWERQIVALGGANYTRNTAMLDEDGKQVPGTRGYKSVANQLRSSSASTVNFLADDALPCYSQVLWSGKGSPGRQGAVRKEGCVCPSLSSMPCACWPRSNAAKSLPTLAVAPENEEAARSELFKRFQNQGPEYYGDFDELSGGLLDIERDEEIKGQSPYSPSRSARALTFVVSRPPCRLGRGLRTAGIDALAPLLLNLDPLPRRVRLSSGPGPSCLFACRAAVNKAGSDVGGRRGGRCRDG
jgi:hypothetical protein